MPSTSTGTSACVGDPGREASGAPVPVDNASSEESSEVYDDCNPGEGDGE